MSKIVLRKPLIGIMAATDEGVIGLSGGNGLPWDIPEELDIYRKRTANAIVLMGRETYEALPEHALKTRIAIVLSTTLKDTASFVQVARTPEESLARAFSIASDQPVFMIGGATALEPFMRKGWISKFFLTRVHHPYPGDTKMDLGQFDGWSAKVDHAAEDFTIFEMHRPGLPG